MALSDNHPMWRMPRHHSDVEHAHDHVHWIELFYDLIQVVTIFMLGNFLSHHLDLQGFIIFLGLFTAVWFAWADSSLFNSLYASTDMWHRVIMALQIVTSMFMAASIAAIESGDGIKMFMLAYAVNRAIIALLYFRAVRHKAEHTSLAWEMARNSLILAVVFALSAFLPQPYNIALFSLAVLSIQILYMLPKIGILRFERFVPRLGHLSERFALLMLIVLGEGFFKLVVTLGEKMSSQGVAYVHLDKLVNFSFGGLSIFILCWIYFDLVGNAKLKDSKPATLVGYWLLHLVIMTAGILIGVALAGEVKVGFFESYDIKYATLGTFGLATYILALGLLQQLTEQRVAHRFARWDVKIFGIVVAIITWFVVPHVPSLVGNAMWGVALFSQIIVPLYRAYTTLSREEKATE